LGPEDEDGGIRFRQAGADRNEKFVQFGRVKRATGAGGCGKPVKMMQCRGVATEYVHGPGSAAHVEPMTPDIEEDIIGIAAGRRAASERAGGAVEQGET